MKALKGDQGEDASSGRGARGGEKNPTNKTPSIKKCKIINKCDRERSYLWSQVLEKLQSPESAAERSEMTLTGRKGTLVKLKDMSHGQGHRQEQQKHSHVTMPSVLDVCAHP